MERIVVEDQGTENGIKRRRISLVNPPAVNVLAMAQSYYSKEVKKAAKWSHKNR